MNIALLVESEAGLLDNLQAHYQTVLFPLNGEVQIYHRTSNGSKGRGQAWIKQDSSFYLPSNPISKQPVAVTLSDRDLQMADLGVISNITAKAMYAYENSTPATAPSAHNVTVDDLTVRLLKNDPSLTDLITDKRRTTPVTLTAPIEPSPMGVTPNVAEVSFAEMMSKPKSSLIEDTDTLSESELAYQTMISVPDPKWAKSYVNRKFNGKTEWEIYDQALLDGDNILVEGGAGSGKTISAQSYASARNYRYFNISSSNGIDPSQLFGRWIPRADGQGYRWQDGAVTLLVRFGGVLLINEVNFLPERVSTVLYSLLDYRREIQLLENGGEVIKAHPDLLIIADMNYGYRGTHELSQAWNDRYSIKLEFPYDRAIENKVVGNKALLSLADNLREMYDQQELSTPISTRSLVAFMRNTSRFGLDFAIASFCNGFNKEERGGVRLACDTFKENIASELGLAYVSHPDNDTFSTEVTEVVTNNG
jgi:AAA domain (dynein-related subfamily)